ncbi:MAG: TPM domain-containing protein [Flavobacteriales bacterium]
MSTSRSVNAADFLTSAELVAVREAVREAELHTSAEVRVHLESHVEGAILDHAALVFEQLGMHRTGERNGVMIYASVADRQLAVIGDKGIHDRVGAGFWNDVIAAMLPAFKADTPAFGLVLGVGMVGEKLRMMFPRQANDRDELSNEVSIG